MAEYYKGYLRKFTDSLVYNQKYFKKHLSVIAKENLGWCVQHCYEEKEKIINDVDAIRVIKNYVRPEEKFLSKEKPFDEEIFFEIIEDENCKYAKEIFTGKIFPILDYKNVDPKFTFKNLRKKLIVLDDSLYLYGFDYKIKIFFDHNLENIVELNNFFYLPDIVKASDIELTRYLDRICKTKNIFGKYIDNKSYKNKIEKLSNSNVFRKKIEKKEEKIEKIVEREKIDTITSHMEKVEFLLLKLEKVNPNKALEYRKKYDSILKNYGNDLTLNPLDINSLISLEAEIEFQIQFSNNNDDSILKVLDNIIYEYNINNKTDKTIKDIDKIFELFLQMKSNYSPITKRNSIEKFALIYIYEIYENKDIIGINDLSNSYINDILKSIIICLNSLIEIGEIENNFIIKLDEDITLKYIIDCIKNINFIKQKVYEKTNF